MSEQQDSFLQELYRLTEGDPEQQVSMYDVGSGLGLERDEAGRLAEGLMVEGLIDLRTLAGGIALTDEGMASLGYAATAYHDQDLQLSDGPIATEHDRVVTEQLCDEIQQTCASCTSYETTELLVIHLKTLDVQMLSEKPRILIIREIFRAILNTMQETGLTPPQTLLAFE